MSSNLVQRNANQPPDASEEVEQDTRHEARENAAAPRPVVTHHPEAFQMACIVVVQALNAADWSVILPITHHISKFIGRHDTYGGWLVASLYIPFPLSLVVFRRFKSYKLGYAFWTVTCVVGNLLYVVFLISRPSGVAYLLLVARLVQGMAQCVTVSPAA